MMNHPAMHIVAKVAKLLCAVAALLIGFQQLGWDFWSMDFVASNPNLSMVLHYVFLVAGVVSLVHWAMCCCGKECKPGQQR